MHLSMKHALALVAWANFVHCNTLTLTGASSKFIGWYVAPNSVQALYAAQSWGTVSNTYVGDCDNNGCTVGTACASGILTMNNGVSSACGQGSTCATFTEFAASPSALPTRLNVACRYGWSAWSVYKELDATVTASSSMSSMTPSPSSTLTTMTPSITSSPTTSTQTSSSPTASSISSTSSGSGSKAWIAGAVIGSLVGIALIFAAILFWRRRQGAQPPAYELGNDAAGYPPMKYAYEKDSHTPPSELPSQHAPHEMYHAPQELYGETAHR